MSWKSIVITGLLCVVAAPAWATPGLVIDLVRSGGLPVLDANGDWQWIVSVDPDETTFADSGPNGTPPNTVGGSYAIEIGLELTGASLVGATVNTTNFDHENFGDSPFAFGEDPADGLTIGSGADSNRLFAAVGSTFFSDGAPKEVMTITTTGPSTVGPNLTTGITWSGAYGGNARIAEAGSNFDTFAGSIAKTVLGGDTNLNGTVNAGDLLTVLNNINQAGKHWNHGDFNGTGVVNASDVLILLNNINQSLPAPGGGSGSVAVPEPASMVLAMLGACAAVLSGWRRRSCCQP
jgi:hypothetical protein